MGFREWVQINDSDNFPEVLAKDTFGGVGEFLRSLANTLTFGFVGASIGVIHPEAITISLWGITTTLSGVSVWKFGLFLWLIAATRDYIGNQDTDLNRN